MAVAQNDFNAALHGLLNEPRNRDGKVRVRERANGLVPPSVLKVFESLAFLRRAEHVHGKSKPDVFRRHDRGALRCGCRVVATRATNLLDCNTIFQRPTCFRVPWCDRDDRPVSVDAWAKQRCLIFDDRALKIGQWFPRLTLPFPWLIKWSHDATEGRAG